MGIEAYIDNIDLGNGASLKVQLSNDGVVLYTLSDGTNQLSVKGSASVSSKVSLSITALSQAILRNPPVK